VRGKRVFIVGRREQSLIETADFSPLIDYLCTDVSTDAGRQRIRKHLNDCPTLDGLIHNAGIIDPIMPITAIDELSWRKPWPLTSKPHFFSASCYMIN